MNFKFKLFFFVQYLSVGIMGPYFALYLYQEDFSGIQVGFLLGSMPIAALLLQPLGGYLSDVLHSRRSILIISCLSMCISIIGIGLSNTFNLVFGFSILWAISNVTIHPIINAMILDHLEKNGDRSGYGPLRSWGSLSFAISSLIFGSLLLQYLGTYFTVILGVLYFILAIICLWLPKDEKPLDVDNHLGSAKFLPGREKYFSFIFGSVFVGASLGIAMNYMSVFLQSLGAQPWIIGFNSSLQALFEVPLMLMTPFLLRKFSENKLILFGALALPIRWILYTFIQNPVWVLPTQILHSVAIVSFMVVGVSFIDKNIEKEWRASGQALYSAAMGGIGSGLGLLLAGMTYEWLGIRSVWWLNIGFGIIGFILIQKSLRQYAQADS
ncbi:MAG: MFS transporter [Anaerolineaceae bacterium]|jgi:PPP family 3-phenylpropionic acid transporter|nr:MFS transporter [Anaerolineaceae bacterium]